MGRKPIKDRICEWYRGVKQPDIPNDPNSGLVFIQLDQYEQPPLAKALRFIGHFWLNHWQWIIGTIIAAIGILIAL